MNRQRNRGRSDGRRNAESLFVVKPYRTREIRIEDLLDMSSSDHAKFDRDARFESVFRLNKESRRGGKQAPIIARFRVDRGHKDGKEIHLVTRRAVVFVLNEHKFEAGLPCIVTVLFARPGQIKRLFEGTGEHIPSTVMHQAMYWQDNGMNTW